MRSVSSPFAVSMMTGTLPRARSVRHSTKPSSPGSITSRMTRSTRAASNAFHMPLPSATAVTR